MQNGHRQTDNRNWVDPKSFPPQLLSSNHQRLHGSPPSCCLLVILFYFSLLLPLFFLLIFLPLFLLLLLLQIPRLLATIDGGMYDALQDYLTQVAVIEAAKAKESRVIHVKEKRLSVTDD